MRAPEIRCPYCGARFAKQTDLADHLSGGGCQTKMNAFHKRMENQQINEIVEDRIQAAEDRAMKFLRGG